MSSPVKRDDDSAAGRGGSARRRQGAPPPLRRPRAQHLLLFVTRVCPAAPVNTFLQRVIHRPTDSWSRPEALPTWGWAPGAGVGMRVGGRLQRVHARFGRKAQGQASPQPSSSLLGYPRGRVQSHLPPTPQFLPPGFLTWPAFAPSGRAFWNPPGRGRGGRSGRCASCPLVPSSSLARPSLGFPDCESGLLLASALGRLTQVVARLGSGTGRLPRTGAGCCGVSTCWLSWFTVKQMPQLPAPELGGSQQEVGGRLLCCVSLSESHTLSGPQERSRREEMRSGALGFPAWVLQRCLLCSGARLGPRGRQKELKQTCRNHSQSGQSPPRVLRWTPPEQTHSRPRGQGPPLSLWVLASHEDTQDTQH